MIRRPLVLVLVLVLARPSFLVRAEPQEIVASLSLEQTVTAALDANAQLHSVRARWEAMQERPVQERTLPNPMFKYGGMDLADGGRWPNTNEKRFMIEQEFPGFGKRAAKGRVAEQDALTMRHEFEALQREVVMTVKETYFDLYGVQQSLSITRAEEAVLERMEQTAETLYSTGERSQQDVIKAQTEITMLKQKLLELEQQEATLKARLNQLLNRRADAPLGLAVTAPQDAPPAAAASLFALAESNRAEIKGAQAQVQRNQYERDVMQKEFWPDYRLGVEYRNFGDSADMVMVTIGFDLPIWQKKYRAGVREAEKMIESSQAGLEAAVQQTAYDVQDASFKLQTARRTLQLYRQSLIPQAEARFRASTTSYRTGTVDFLDLLESERFLLSARVMAAMAEGNLGMQLARLERAVGTELPQREEQK